MVTIRKISVQCSFKITSFYLRVRVQPNTWEKEQKKEETEIQNQKLKGDATMVYFLSDESLTEQLTNVIFREFITVSPFFFFLRFEFFEISNYCALKQHGYLARYFYSSHKIFLRKKFKTFSVIISNVNFSSKLFLCYFTECPWDDT